jgi:drug/metabolite transporter (DMT)-like permease
LTATLWAALSGVGFGLFQTLNGRAVRELDSPYVSTFLQLLIASVILGGAALVTEDPAELLHLRVSTLAILALAGLVHFLGGWTMLNLSHGRIGAARTSPLLAMTPLFGLFFAAIITGVVPGWPALLGIALTVAGAYAVAEPRITGAGTAPRDSVFGIGTAIAWALGAVLTAEGLKRFDSALLGVTVGVVTATLAYGLVLLAIRAPLREVTADRPALALKLSAGVLVALATWARWIALEDIAIAVVLALQLISVPVVLILASVTAGAWAEAVSARVWTGAGLVIGGGLVLLLGT